MTKTLGFAALLLSFLSSSATSQAPLPFKVRNGRRVYLNSSVRNIVLSRDIRQKKVEGEGAFKFADKAATLVLYTHKEAGQVIVDHVNLQLTQSSAKIDVMTKILADNREEGTLWREDTNVADNKNRITFDQDVRVPISSEQLAQLLKRQQVKFQMVAETASGGEKMYFSLRTSSQQNRRLHFLVIPL